MVLFSCRMVYRFVDKNHTFLRNPQYLYSILANKNALRIFLCFQNTHMAKSFFVTHFFNMLPKCFRDNSKIFFNSRFVTLFSAKLRFFILKSVLLSPFCTNSNIGTNSLLFSALCSTSGKIPSPSEPISSHSSSS